MPECLTQIGNLSKLQCGTTISLIQHFQRYLPRLLCTCRASVMCTIFIHKYASLITSIYSINFNLVFNASSMALLFSFSAFILELYLLNLSPYRLPSSLLTSKVNQEDLLELLGKAVTCAVLGKAGPQRSRVLGLLYKVTESLSLSEC